MWLLRFFERNRGSVSILLTIILIPTLMLSGLLVDLANRNMSKALAEEAGELAADSILARYDTVLEDVYGIFAVSQNYDDLQANVMQYMSDTISAAGYLQGGDGPEMKSRLMQALAAGVNSLFENAAADAAPGLIRASVSDVSAGKLSSANLLQADILENQIVEFMKYRGPAEVGLDLISTLTAFKSLNEQSDVVEKKTAVDETVNDMSKKAAELYDAIKTLDALIKDVEAKRPGWEMVTEELDYANTQFLNLIYDAADVDRSSLVRVSRDETAFYLTDGNNAAKELKKLEGDKATDTAAAQASAEALEEYTDLSSLYGATSGRVEEVCTAYNDHMENVVGLLKGLNEAMETLDAELAKAEEERDPSVILQMNTVIGEINTFLNKDALEKWDKVGCVLADYSKYIDEAYGRLKTSLDKVNNGAADSLRPVNGLRDYWRAVEKVVKKGEPVSLATIGKVIIREDTSFIGYILGLIDGLYSDMDKLKTAKGDFNDSLGEYKEKVGEDSYYTNMSAQAQETETLLTRADLDELREQVSAIKAYLDEEYNALEKGMFYDTRIPAGSLPSGKKMGQDARRLLQTKAEGDSRYIRTEENREELRDLTRSTMILVHESPTIETGSKYLKQLMKVHELYYGGPRIPVPKACLTLSAQFGGSDDSSDGKNMEKQLKKSVKNQSDEGEEASKDKSDMASGMTSPFDYIYTVFGEEDSSAAGNGGSKKAVTEDDASAAIKQLSNMIQLVKDMLSALGNVVGGNWEAIRDDLLITEYIYENFSNYYHTTKTYQEEAAKKDGKPGVFKIGSLYYPTSMTGVVIAPYNNTIYGCEQEYILYGYKGKTDTSGILFWKTSTQTGPGVNIDSVKGNIYAIRLVCNAIFALTDSGLDQETIPPAAAIQAATAGVFPMQVAQVILKIALAMLETSLDMNDIMAGKKVALFKNSETWTCSINGLIRKLKDTAVEKAKDVAKDVAREGIKELSGTLNNLISDGIDGIEGSTVDMIGSIADDVSITASGMLDEAISSVTSVITTKARDFLNQAFLSTAAGHEKSEAELKSEFTTLINDSVDQAIGSLTVSQQVKDILTNLFRKGGNALVEKIWGMDKYVTDYTRTPHPTKNLELNGEKMTLGKLITRVYKAAADPSGTASDLLDGCINKAANAISSAVKSYIDANIDTAKNELNGLVSDISDKLKAESGELVTAMAERAEDKVDECVDRMGNAVSEKLNELFPESELDLDGGTSLGSAVGNDMNASGTARTFMAGYQDYLLVFLFLGVCGNNHDAIVSRIGEVIGMNLRGASDDNGTKGGMQAYRKALDISDEDYQDGSFNPKAANTYITISCKVKIKPVLLSQKLVMGSRTDEIAGNSFWEYTYTNIAGY